MEDVVKKLSPHEKKVLLALKKLQEAATGEIAKETGLSEDTVHKAGQWASMKGLVEHREEVETKAELTEEGKRYSEEGVPEKKLLEIVSKKTMSIQELNRSVDNFSIALAWAKKKGWVQMAGGKVSITKTGREVLSKSTPVEEGLRGNFHENNLDELRARKLVTVREKKTKMLSLTEKGRQILPHLKDMKAIKEEVGQLTPSHIKTGKWKDEVFREYDVNTPVPTLYTSTIHPYVQFINETRRKMIALGFHEMKGPFTETEFWNMDALFMPQDHPARGIHDVFRLKKPSKGEVKDKMALERVGKTHKNGWITGSTGWGHWNQEQTLNLVLRSHTTCVSARTLASGPEIPSKFFTIDRVFRPDVLDATHSFEFHQMEGIILGENLNIRNLLGYLELFGREVAGAEDIRFRPGYFPFTEPSVEMDAKIGGKWVEIGGSGIFRPELTKPLGIDASVLAWGLGFGRLAMIKLGISDMRDLFNHDVEWLRKRRLVV